MRLTRHDTDAVPIFCNPNERHEMKPTLKQIRAELKEIGDFRIATMSGGYVALYAGSNQIEVWIAPEQCIAVAQDYIKTNNQGV